MTRAAALLGAALLLGVGCARSVASDQTVRSPTGAIIEPGELGTEHLQVGDCVQGPVPDEVEALFGVPCHRAHTAQVLAIGDDAEFNALTSAGLFGKATSLSPFLSQPMRLNYAGHVTRGGDKLTMLSEITDPDVLAQAETLPRRSEFFDLFGRMRGLTGKSEPTAEQPTGQAVAG